MKRPSQAAQIIAVVYVKGGNCSVVLIYLHFPQSSFPESIVCRAQIALNRCLVNAGPNQFLWVLFCLFCFYCKARPARIENYPSGCWPGVSFSEEGFRESATGYSQRTGQHSAKPRTDGHGKRSCAQPGLSEIWGFISGKKSIG